MKIVPIASQSRREYPHLITEGARANQRCMLRFVDGVANGAHEFGEGLLDANRHVTAEGRSEIVARFGQRARGSASRYCIVWAADDCTWVDGKGRPFDGRNPPEGVPVDPREMNSAPVALEDAWTILLPTGCISSHLSIRKIAAGYVEIAPAAPMFLAHFDEPLDEGEDDPSAGMMDADGRLVAPATWRNQPVTGVVNDWSLTGPVQPSAAGKVLRNPWPDAIAAACDEVAGRALPSCIHEAAWRVYDPDRSDMVFVGVLEAA